MLQFSTMHSIVLFAALALAGAANIVSYEGFKVYQVLPLNQIQLDLLNTLADSNEYDFWSDGRGINVDVDVMVSPQSQAQFEELLQQSSMKYKIIIENVESVVQNERIAQQKAPKAAEGQITFTKYHRHSEIQSYLKNLQNKYPEIVKLYSVGKSVLGLDLTLVEISTDYQANKPAIFIDAGIHAREWIAPSVALYILQEIIENPANKHLLEHFDWHIIPLLNPDGYEYSQTDERFWRKNRSTHESSKCLGVDLNRNFGDHWGGLGTSSNPCSEIYKGTGPFSEPEAAAVEKYLLNLKGKFKLYLTLHNYGQYILHPWGWGYELPEDTPELKHLGDLAAAAIESVYNTKYKVGSVTQILSPGAGGSDDWAKSGAGIKYSYTIELPGGGKLGFDLPPSQIAKVVEETFAGIVAFHDHLVTELL